MITLDRPRELRLGHKAIKKLEELTGRTLASMDPDNFSSSDIEKAMYCMMLSDAAKNGEILEIEKMEDLLDMIDYGTIVERMGAAFESAFGVVNEKNALMIAAKNGTGKKA